MAVKSKEEKTQEIKDILRLRLIEAATYKEITAQVGVARPTAIRYINKFKSIVSDEDFAIKDTYNEAKRKVPFPARWKKYVKIIIDSCYVYNRKTVATPDMVKKIIDTAATVNMNATETYNLLGRVPSYDTIAKVIRGHRTKTNPPTE